jgi:hypothetical protein
MNGIGFSGLMLLRVQPGGKWGIDIDSDSGVSCQLHWELSGIPCFYTGTSNVNMSIHEVRVEKGIYQWQAENKLFSSERNNTMT